MSLGWLPLLSGLLLALSLPPFPTTLLPFLALVPFGVFLRGLPGDRWGRGAAWVGGLRLGVVLFSLLLYWIPFALSVHLWQGVLAYLLAVALLSLFPALAAALTHRAVHRHRLPLWVALPVAWTASEWLRAHIPGGLAFPWLGIAASLTHLPDALGLAEWVGERGVALWIVLVNALFAEALVRRRGPDALPRLGLSPRSALPRFDLSLRSAVPGFGLSRRSALAGAVVLVVPVAGGFLRGHELPRGPSLRVALVETALPRSGQEEPGRAAQAMAEALDRLLPSLEPGSADLVVLPETAFPVPLETPSGRPWLQGLVAHARRLQAPLVVGALGGGEAGEGVYNSVFVVDSGGIRARYDKRRLVPGVERLPLFPSPFLRALGDTLSFARGSPRPLLAAGGTLLGPLVCYESAFGELAREHDLGGARLLVNLTNDGWFGSWGGGARAQHEAHLVLRAIEGRIGVARAANGGASLVVSPRGRVRKVTAVEGEGVEVVDVPMGGSPTPFVRLGDVVGVLSTLLALLAFLPRRPLSALLFPRQAGEASGASTPATGAPRTVERSSHGVYISQAVEPLPYPSHGSRASPRSPGAPGSGAGSSDPRWGRT